MRSLVFLASILIASICSAQVEVDVQNGQETKSPSIITVNTSSEKCFVWVRKTLFKRLQTYELKTTSKDIRQFLVMGKAGKYSVEVWVDGVPTLAVLEISSADRKTEPDDEKQDPDPDNKGDVKPDSFNTLFIVEETSKRTLETAKILNSPYWLDLKSKNVDWRIYDKDDVNIKPIVSKLHSLPALVFLKKTGQNKLSVVKAIPLPQSIEELKEKVGK